MEGVGRVVAPGAFLVSGCALKLHPLDPHRGFDGGEDFAVHRSMVTRSLCFDRVPPSGGEANNELISKAARVCGHVTSL